MSQLLSALPRRLLRGANRPNVLGAFGQVRSKSDASRLPPYLLNIPPTQTTALKNGLIVATEEQPGAQTATVGVWVNSGTIHETGPNIGVAHFLEHMAFKGTAKRSQQALELEVENMGASLNAYTSREQTVYFAKCFKSNVPNCVDLLADILQHSAFTEENIERERGTILREAEEIENSTEEVLFDHLHAAAYQGTPLARNILGPAEDIRKISRQDLLSHIKHLYTGPRMVLAGAGAVKHSELVALAEQAFAAVSGSDSAPAAANSEYIGAEVRIRNDDMPYAHVAVGVEGVGWTDPDYYTLQVIQTLLGSWDRNLGAAANSSSRLAEVIATDKLAHSYNTFNTSYGTTGLIGNYAIAPPDKLDALLGEITDEWQRIANSVTPTEVERAKARLKASLFLSLDGNTPVAEEIGRQILSIGRRLSPAEVVLRINDITAADVRRVAAKHFTDVSPVLSAIGPIDDLPDYNILRGWTYWNRL